MPLSPRQTRTQLESLGHFPRKQLGQNFLVDGNIVRKSIELAGLQAGDRVVEVGPGLGTLTRALLEAGVELWAVERDATLAAHLRTGLSGEYPETFHLLEGDAVDAPLAELPIPDEKNDAAEERFKIVANLPYAISTPWMEGVLSMPHLPERMVLMLQKEAADRLVAASGTKAFGAVSIFLQAAYELAERHPVAPACFYPEPQVASVLVRLDRKPEGQQFPKRAREAIRALFTQRRKQLRALCKKSPESAVLSGWFAACVAEGLAEDVRAEAVPLAAWLRLRAHFLASE